MRSHVGTVLALAFALLAADCPDEGVVAPPSPTGVITGVVTIDGEVAGGITVNLSSGDTGVTDASGQYQFTGVPAGAYTAAISGYPADVTFEATAKAVVIARDGQVVTANFSGTRAATASVIGSVTVGGSALSGVLVAVSGPASGSSTTDGHGQYAVIGLPAGSYTVGISGFDSNSYDFVPTVQSTSLSAGETRVVDFTGTEAKTASLGVQVNVDESGAEGVGVAISGPASGTATTDANGAASFSGLPRGGYTVAITNPDPDHITFDETTKSVTIADIGGSGAVTFEGTTMAPAVSVSLGVGVSVGSDPAGHEQYVGMTGVGTLNVDLENGSLSVSGNGAWIPVSGSLNSDGTFTLTGSGEAAGVSGVSVKFEGQLTRDDQGTINGISGTLTVGVNGELYGTPVTYDVASG